jgi:hypothetical protein
MQPYRVSYLSFVHLFEGIDKYDGEVGDLEIGFASFYLMLIRMKNMAGGFFVYR